MVRAEEQPLATWSRDDQRSPRTECSRAGIQPYPFGPCNGNRHDGFLLAESEILDELRDICRRLGQDYVLFGDSAYPISRWLWRMYKGVMTAMQRAFNADMSPGRVSVEWGFGKIVTLWPFLDYRKKHQVLLTSPGLHFGVGNILTNIHTCLYGTVQGPRRGKRPVNEGSHQIRACSRRSR